jgi:diacylglycerol kinase (ATP)
MEQLVTFIIHGRIKFLKNLKLEIETVFAGFSIAMDETQKAGDAMTMAKMAIAKGSDFIVAVGGDGTINEIVNGIMQSKSPKKPILAVLPLGRGNDFVRTFPASKNLEQLVEAIKQPIVTQVDVGSLTFTGLKGTSESRFFINIADVGIGGVVTQIVSSSRRVFNAKVTYTLAILRSLFSFTYKEMKVRADNFSFEGDVMSLCMANGKYFGSGLCIAPSADLFDGKAEIVILEKISLWEFLKHLARVRRGEKIKHPKVYYLQTTTCSISATGPCPLDVDGEFVGYTPVEMTMLPAAIRMLKIKA